MRFEFHAEALAEYHEAALFYAEREPGLERRFIGAVEEAIELVKEAPTRWRILDDDVRRSLTHVFPYGILYTIEADYILIVTIMHCSREPGYWKQRVR